MTGRELARRGARLILLLVGVGFMTVAFTQTADDLDRSLLPGIPRLAAAAVLAATGVLAGGRAWVRVLGAGGTRARRLAHGFHLSQLGKYLPGAVWQVVGLIASAREAGERTARASTSFVAFAIVQVVAGATVGALLVVTGTRQPLVVRAVCGAGVLSLVVLDRRWMSWVAGCLRRDPALVPGQPALVRSWAWSALTMVFAGGSFALLLDGIDPDQPFVASISVWAIAWTVGFVAIPFPAGVGVREAVLVGLLAGSGDGAAAAVIAASVYHRLATIAGEALAIAAYGVATRRSRAEIDTAGEPD